MSAPATTPTPSSGHTSRAKDPAIVREAQKPIEFISGILGTAAIGLVVLFLIFWGRGCANERKDKKAEARSTATYATTYTTPQVVKVGKEEVTHRFGSDGCVEVFLKGSWTSYPQPLDQEIHFFDQQGRLVLKQGVKKQGSSLSAAQYRICKAPKSEATGVQIWN